MPDAKKSPASPETGMRCLLRRDKLVSQFCEVIPSTLEGLNSVQEKAIEVLQSLPCAPEDVEGVSLALREALANAVLHGNQNDPSKRVVVACFCECEGKNGLLLVVRDEGPGFDPGAVPDPTGAEAVHEFHGRGIFLMRHFMDEVRFERGGSEVLMRKDKG